ncbi:MAG: hypothetical protein ACRDOL_35135 [Streptosporangiaceae bacterium]
MTPPRTSIPASRASWQLVQQLRTWNRRQWAVAGWSYLAAFLLLGVIGETLPGASLGRETPVEWWNYVTLALSPVLIALIAATFVTEGESKRSRRAGKTSTGAGAAVGTLTMACPLCNPLAVPLFGASGVVAFLRPDRGLIALASIALLLLTLLLRLRTTRACRIVYPTPGRDDHRDSPSRQSDPGAARRMTR